MNNEQGNLNNIQENNAPKFDPMTGQPINTENNINKQSNNVEMTNEVKKNIHSNNSFVVQAQMQSIATVEQNNEQFINNIQANNSENNDNLSSKKNLIFMIVLFIIVLVAIIFLFPYLSKFI